MLFFSIQNDLLFTQKVLVLIIVILLYSDFYT